MNNTKENRAKLIKECLDNIITLKSFYYSATVGWTLTRAAFGFIHSLDHLENETDFADETLGVSEDLNNENQ